MGEGKVSVTSLRRENAEDGDGDVIVLAGDVED